MRTRENMTPVGNGFYVVRTQAGFRKAVKQFIADRDHAYLRVRDVCGFPKSYPALVSFAVCYRGYDYIDANCIPLRKVVAAAPDTFPARQP